MTGRRERTTAWSEAYPSHLQPQKLDRKPGNGDDEAGDGVHIPLHKPKPYFRQSPVKDPHHNQHGGYGGDAECQGNPKEAPPVVLCGGVHENGDEGFAGSQHENDEQHPRSDGFGIAMQMGMRTQMVVVMRVGKSLMGMGMTVLPGPPADSESPHTVGQPETDEQPAGDIPPDRFNAFQGSYGDPQQNSRQAQQDGSQHMTHSAEEGDGGGPCPCPVPGAADHDEGQVVIRPDDCVDEPDAYGGIDEDVAFHFSISSAIAHPKAYPRSGGRRGRFPSPPCPDDPLLLHQ